MELVDGWYRSKSSVSPQESIDGVENNKILYNSSLKDNHKNFKKQISEYCENNNIKFIDKNILSIPNIHNDMVVLDIFKYIVPKIIDVKEDIFLFEILQDIENIEDLNKIFNICESKKIFISMKHKKYPNVNKIYVDIGWWDEYISVNNNVIYSDAEETQKIRDYVDQDLKDYLNCFFCIKSVPFELGITWIQREPQ
jgi:hypothetical protein